MKVAQTAGLPPESKLFPTVPISKCQFNLEINIFKPSVSTLIQKYKEGFFLLTHSFKSYYSSNGAFLKYGYKNIYDSDILRFQSGSQSRMISNPQPCFIQPKVYVYKKNSSQKNCGTVVGHIFVHIVYRKNVMIWTKCGLMVVSWKVCNVHQWLQRQKTLSLWDTHKCEHLIPNEDKSWREEQKDSTTEEKKGKPELLWKQEKNV